MALVYATLGDLTGYTAGSTYVVPGEPEATRVLTAASKAIRRATKSAVYDTDTNGYPSDAAVRQAFRDATCAQVVWWKETGDELGTGGAYDSVSIGSVSLSRGRGSGQTEQNPRLAPQAATELGNAGLLPGSVVQIQTWEGTAP